METKKFNRNQITLLRNRAANVYKFAEQRDRLKAKRDAIQAELNEVEEALAAEDALTVKATGFTSEELFIKEVKDTGKVDKQGHAIRTTKYVLRYPETVVPVVDAEGLDNLNEEEVYDDAEKAEEIEVEDAIGLGTTADNPNIPYMEMEEGVQHD